jgi:ABC-type nickel/cobalt efflux system permease component RcnA
MLVLGLLLILGSAGLGADLLLNDSASVPVEILGHKVDMTAAGFFFSGTAAMLLFMLGVWLLTSKMSRSRRKRVERKASRREQRDSVAQLERERAKLAAENERLSQKLDSRQDTTATDGAKAGTTPNGDTNLRDGQPSASHSAGGKHA